MSEFEQQDVWYPASSAMRLSKCLSSSVHNDLYFSLSISLLALSHTLEYDHYPGGWTPPEYIRIPGVRFAPEVPDKECNKCPYAAWGHPYILDPKRTKETGAETYQFLCTKDCLKAGIPLKRDKASGWYKLVER